VDRKNKTLAFGAGTYDFQKLYELRKGEHFEKQNTLDVRGERDARCQHQLDVLGERLAKVNPDVLIIVGDDHHEWFLNDIQPAFSIFHGKAVFNRALTKEEEQQKIANGGGYAMKIYYPQRDETYPCPSDLAAHIIGCTIQEDFDTAALGEQPQDAGVPRQLGHSYGFIYRRILKSRPVPPVPILVNTYSPPNQPTAKRCFNFGRAVAPGQGVAGQRARRRGGIGRGQPLRHRRGLRLAHHQRDETARLQSAHRRARSAFRSGTSETKNWLVVAGMLAETGLDMELLDYVPCYRSEAGTGSGMAFATWQ
jgi:hypothetical protein